jgi:glutathione S-transferase
MIRLYHCVDARSFRPLWTLEELGLEYELVMMAFPPRFTFKDYLALNPVGTVPTFFDGDMRMTESAAITQYLVTRYGPTSLAVEAHEPAFGPYLNWLHHGEATLTFPQTLVLRYSRLEPEERRLPQVVEDYSRWFVARLRLLDGALADGREWLCADRFTAADISVGFALLLAGQLGLDARFTPAIAAYWARLQARPGFISAKAVQAKAAADQLDADQS